MVQLDKRYFPLKEVAKRWGLRKRDLVYMAEVGELRTSVRIPGAHIEQGMSRSARGQQHPRPLRAAIWFTGLQDLTAEDAFLVFRNGEADVVSSTPASPTSTSASCPRARRSGCGPSTWSSAAPSGIGSRRSIGGRPFRRGGPRLPAFARLPLRPLRRGVMVLGVVQARIVRILHQAADSHLPWCAGKAVLSRGRRRLAPDGGRVQVPAAVPDVHRIRRTRATTGCDPSRNRCGDGAGFTILPANALSH